MSLSRQRKDDLEALRLRLRRDLIRVLHGIQTGHPGGSPSMTEILVTPYFEKLRIDPARPQDPGRDRFILSKGHGAPMLYEVLAERGFFPREARACARSAVICRATPAPGKRRGSNCRPGRSASGCPPDWAWPWPPAWTAGIPVAITC